jgi:hypothetical protein
VNEFVDLEPDELVAELEAVAGEQPDLVALAGFLGAAHGEGAENRIRLYETSSMSRWIEIDRGAVRKRERIRQERGALAPLTLIWVDAGALRQEFDGVPDRVQMEFLNDRAELGFEPPRSLLEAVEYMKMSADYYYGITRLSRAPRWHC